MTADSIVIGGDVVTILVIIILVLLAIALAKRVL
jgi:hypothetical protein